LGWLKTTRLVQFYWTRHGTEDFLGPIYLAKGLILFFPKDILTLILMGDWCGEDITDILIQRNYGNRTVALIQVVG
jgi:hypothetical protein